MTKKELYKIHENGRTFYEVRQNGEIFYRIAKTLNHYTLYIYNQYQHKFIPSRYFKRLRNAKKAAMI